MVECNHEALFLLFKSSKIESYRIAKMIVARIDYFYLIDFFGLF